MEITPTNNPKILEFIAKNQKTFLVNSCLVEFEDPGTNQFSVITESEFNSGHYKIKALYHIFKSDY